jgi:hypothetical protein
MTPMTSDSLMMRRSSPSSLISQPDHLPNRMQSTGLTSSGTIAPFVPGARTDGDDFPPSAFPWEASGMKMPRFFRSWRAEPTLVPASTIAAHFTGSTLTTCRLSPRGRLCQPERRARDSADPGHRMVPPGACEEYREPLRPHTLLAARKALLRKCIDLENVACSRPSAPSSCRASATRLRSGGSRANRCQCRASPCSCAVARCST